MSRKPKIDTVELTGACKTVTLRARDADDCRRITKIKYKGDRVRVWYEKDRETGETDEYMLSCADAPVPEFTDVFAGLARFVVDAMEIPAEGREEWQSRVFMRGVSFSWKAEKAQILPSGGPRRIMGAVLTAVRKTMDGQTICLNTPHKSEDSYVENDPAGEEKCLSAACATQLWDLIRLAMAYIDGERAQLSLPFSLDGKSLAAGEREDD